MQKTEEQELLTVITDFLEQGYADSIAAMFRQDPSCYSLTGDLLKDERFMVRMGTAVLFEELVDTRSQEVELAIPTLLPLLEHETPWVRGEAANILGIIGTKKALALLGRLRRDSDPQVLEIVNDILGEA